MEIEQYSLADSTAHHWLVCYFTVQVEAKYQGSEYPALILLFERKAYLNSNQAPRL